MQMSLSKFSPSRCHEQSDDKYDMNNESLFLSHHDPLAPHTQTQQGRDSFNCQQTPNTPPTMYDHKIMKR